MEQKKERIAKVIARSGFCSRRAAEELINDKKVSLNGKIIESCAVNVSEEDVIEINGKPISSKEKTRVWMFYKPIGCITSNKDPEGRQTVFDILPKTLPRVITVGRLDYNSEGLLLLTNDGEYARFLEHPSNKLKRTYRVRAYGKIDEKKLDLLQKGVKIDGINYAPCVISMERRQGGNSWFLVTITEGKNREIRKMFEFASLSVNRLIRISYGDFQLGNLKPGEVKEVPVN